MIGIEMIVVQCSSRPVCLVFVHLEEYLVPTDQGLLLQHKGPLLQQTEKHILIIVSTEYITYVDKTD